MAILILNGKIVNSFKTWIETLIKEKDIKGKSLSDNIPLKDHIGLTWQMLVDFLADLPSEQRKQIKSSLSYIDFKNGDIFDYLLHLAKGMLTSLGYEVTED